MGSKVNPAFISAFNRLKSAKDKLNSLEKNKNSFEYRKAEIVFHNAEKEYCNQPGLVEDNRPNALTKEEALKQVNGFVNTVASWYV